MPATDNLTTRDRESSERGEFEYRALSTGAIAAIIFGVLSLLTPLAGRDSLEACLLLCPIPLVGLLVGWRAWSSIRAQPQQLSGMKLAAAGTLLSIFGLVSGLGYAGYVHATEVPPNYTRTSFQEFRPDENEERIGIPIPKDVEGLDGKQVFLKGYMRADSVTVRHNIRRFLLVRDNYQCCFGDLSNVKFYDQVLVDFVDNVTADYSTGLFRIAGTLHLHPENLGKGPGNPVYTMDANYVQ